MSLLAAEPLTQDEWSPGDAQTALFAWVEDLYGGPITRSVQTSGGNRCQSWSIDVTDRDGGVSEVFLRYAPPRPPSAEPYTVHREAQVYRAIEAASLLAPRLLAEHPKLQAVLTERAHGIAEFRRLTDPATKQAIARQFMQNLARLHRMPTSGVRLDGGGDSPDIAGHVLTELRTWRAMYEETGQRDALIDLAFHWLDANMPHPSGPVVLVHGDAGPGNFLFEHGQLTALIDWELAHLGDPMEDIAWYSMRCVMEPVPDFAASIRDYEHFSGAKIDRARVLYHRVLVSARVVVIRHRNVTGEPAHAIVSRALNRRLLIEALAEASGCRLATPDPLTASPTSHTALFEHVLTDLRDVIVARSTDSQVIAKAKNAAKIIKYLQAHEQFGDAVKQAQTESLPHGIASEAALVTALEAGRITLPDALQYFAGEAARQAQLAASASGGIAHRHYPAL